MPEDTEAAIGSRKRFECRVIGYPVPKITWLKDDVNITRSDRYKFDYSTDGYVTMEIQNVTYADVGSYQCLAVNSEGWASTTAHLKVKGRHVDAADDTMTIHRMTFEKSGSRDDIQDLQQVIAYQHADFVDRSLLPEEVQPIFITKQQRGYDADQFSLDKSENVTSSNKANIGMDADSLSALIENESGVVPKEMAVKAPSRDKDETDSGISGIFSTSSSVDHKDREDINFKEKISISVVDEDPDLESGQTFDQIDIEQIGYLKADDIFNKGRRLTGDSGIADDDFSPTSSDDETMNRKMSSDKGKRNKTDVQHNVNTDQKSSTDPAYQRRSGEGIDSQKCSANPEYQSRSGKENDSQKCPTDPEYRCQCGEGNRSLKGPNDKTTPEERAEAILKSERNKDTSTCESKESINEDPNDILKSLDKTRIVVDGVNDAKNNIDKIIESSKEPRHGKERFQEESSLQENKSANSITIYSKQAETEEESNGQYETECKIQPGNVKTTTQNADSDGNEDVFHSDEEEHKILQEIRPNLHRHKAAMDDTRSNTVSFQSEESWSVYESCDDISLSEFNFDTVSGHYLNEEDFIFTRLDSKSGKVAGLKTVREDPETDKAVENGSCCTQSRDDHDESFPEAETTIGFTNGDKDQTTKRHSSNSNKSRDNSCNEKNENNDRKPICKNTNQGKHDTALDDTVPNDATKFIPERIICDDGTMDQGLIYNESPPHEIASNDFGATGVDSDNGRQDQFGVNDRVVSNERKDSVEDCPIEQCDEHATFKERIDEQLDKSNASKIQGQFDESNEQGNEMYNTHQTNEYVVACLSDEDENEVLREIRPHLRLNKSPVDETRSNTFSLLSGESWSVYDSEFDYTLSETNFDSISYQKLGDDDDVDFTISVDNCKVDKGIVPVFESAICSDEQSKSRERDKMEEDADIRSINREQLGESRVNYENILDLKKKLEDMLAGEEANPLQDQTNQPFEVEKGIVNSFMLSNEKKARNNNDDFSDGDRNSLPADELELERAELLQKLDLSSYIIEKKEKTDPCHVLTEKHTEAGSVIDDTRGTGSVSDDTSGKKLKSHIMDNKNDTVEQKGATDSENGQDEDDIICEQRGVTGTKNGQDGDDVTSEQRGVTGTKNGQDGDIICEQRGVTGTKNGQGGDDVTSEQRDATYTENDQNAELRSKALLLLHTMATQDWLEEGGSVEDINETRPALPNTLHLSSDLIASVFGQLATNTGLQISSSPPNLEELDFDGFVNAETIVPVTETRASLLSPISEEGTISQTNESVEVLSPESSQNNSNSSTLSKTKRPSLIGLTITDTNGVVEHIDLDNIDDLESSPNHFYERGLDLGVGEIPRIVKGPSSVTSYDGGEIVLQWSILGSPEPEVVVFKDGDALDICDGITLEHEGTTWTLLIPDAMKEDAGLYEICAVNSSGNDILKTRVYVKTVNNFPKKEEYDCTVNSTERDEPPGVPQFIKAPKSTVAEVGQKISVQCEVSGTPVPILQWYKDGEPVEQGDRFEVIQDQSKCHLVIQPSLLEDSGIYLCTAANSVGVDQVQFTVSVSEKDEARSSEEEDETPEFSVGSEQGNDCRPSAPLMQLDMTESDECFSKRYQLVCNYHDNFNNVDVEEGEIIEVLDRSQASHWLVKSLKNKSKICYVPPDVLVDCSTGLDSTWNCYDSNRRLSKEELTAKTKEVIHELLESEADYICDLKDILDTYTESTKEGNREPVQEGEITRVNKPTSSCGVFDQLSKLYQFHKKKLLPSLLTTSDNTENVGKIFTKQGDDFSNYIPFVSEHDKVTDKAESDQLQALLEAFSLLTGDPATAFEDLLNRPLERIHEYIDLLKTLIKLTAQSGGDCTGLMAAVQMLSEICRNMEDIVLLDKITGYDGDVRELGPVLKHENVLKITEEESEGQRHVILFPDKIMVTKPLTSDPKGKLEFEKVIELKDLSVCEQDETSGCHIELWEDKTSELSASPLLKLQVQDIHTKRAWVRDIQRAKKLLECNKTIKDTMPEFTQKLKGKKLTSTPKKSKLVKSIDSVETESDRSSDDFNILGTRKDLVGDRYVAAEFEDGTTRPMFKRKLQKTIVEESTTVRLECEVSGIPQPKVLWMKNNRPLLESDHCKVITEGATHILEFTDARRSDTGLYTARAMNVNGSTISTAELYVGEVQPSLLNKYKEGLSDAKYQTPAYFFQMNSCQVEEGRLARFDCRVVAYPKPDIIWMKDGKIVEPNDRYQLLNFNNEIYSLLIQNVVKGDMGRYTCWAHNKYGEAMTEAYLNVIAYHDQEEEGDIAPRFLTRFYDQTLTEGVPAELQCLIDGRPIPTVKWLFNDIEIIPDDNLSILQDKNLCALYIKSVTGKDLGTYSCNLKNPLGEASCTAGLNVLSDKIKNVPVLPKFLKRIGDQNMRTGENVTFEVVVIGEPPPKVTWLYNHKPISETRRRFKMTQDGDKYTLTIEDLILDDDGKITCKAVNSEGEVYCSGNLLVRESRRTSEKPEEPKFTQKDFDAKYGYVPTFIKKIEDIYIPSGKDGKFECRVMGIPEPTVTWHRDGRPLKNDGHYLISQDNQYCYLTIRGAKELDQGVYTCTISNAAGENSCTAYMRLGDAKRPGDLSRESSVTPLSRRGTGDVPTMPYDKPTVSDIRPESVRLTWQPVLTSALSSDSRNIKYAIEGRELPDADWRKMASGIHGNTHVVRNLRPQRDYDFRVRAENKFGASDATQPASLERPRPEEEDFAESMKSKVPQYRRPPDLPKSKPLIADIGAETVKLAWQPAPVPRDLKAPPPPISYRLEAQELPSTDWLPLSSRLTDTSTYLSDLLPDRDYNIRVRAENKYGLSEPTEPIWIPRAKAFPGVPIARPEIIEMEPHSIKLRWDRVEVPSFSNDDEPLLYMIEMQEPPIRDWTPVARDIASTVYVVSDLEPGQDYRFRVRARTPRGILSEPSPVASVYRTVASTTAPIDSLELDDEDVDFDGIRLRWNRVPIPPYSGDDEPLLYMIEMNEPPLDEWRPIISGLPTTRYRVTDLLPDRDYHFRVRALSSYGISPPSYTLPVSYRRPTPGPSRILPEYPKITYDDSDALQLSWQPLKTSTPIKEPIRYRVEMQAPPSLAWKPLATGVPDTRYPIRGLGPSRDYMFRVIPETTSGLLEPLPPVSLTSLPAPRTFLPSRPEIHDYTPDSLELSWRRPYIDSHTPLLYRIEVQEPPSVDWRPLVSDISDTRYRVSGLQPSRDYTFRVVPYHGSDYWEPLPPVSITSLPVKPRFRPHEPTITPYGDDSLKLSWQPADIPVYPRKPVPIRYIVDMRTLPRYDWTPLARNVIVKGLSPSKEYEFRVRPQTDYGIGEPTLPVTFYRKPVPMVRREPVISNIYGDSVLLSWQPAEVRGDFRFPTSVTYSIEMQERPGIGPWLPMVTGITGTNYHVTGLHPDREYFFRVRGHVGDVFGEPSAPVYLTHRAGPPKMPHEQPYISELNPNSVHLQWRAVHLPHRITDYAPVTYRLEVQELPRSDWGILADGIPHTDFHVTNLNPDKEYNFRIRAINKYGSSEPTPLVMIRRRAVPPTMPKDEPMIYDIGHGSLMLSWRPADVPYYLGDSPVTYTIYVQESPSMTWRPLYRRIPYTSYHVTNLHSDRDYAFRVQAENMYGVSQPTNTIRLTRMSDFSSPIDIPEITEFDETRSSLMLQWKRRSQTPFDSKPVRYHIESWEPVKRTWRRMATDIPDTNYRLTGLSPENDYILRIRAEAESVLSEPSYPVSTGRFRAKVPITRPQLYDVESDSVRLSWQPYPGRTPPRRYKLEMKETSTKDWRPVTTDVYGTTHKVTGLKPKYDYEFRLRGITEQGPTDYVYSVPLYRRSVIPRLPLAGVDVVNVDDDSVDLRWRLVDIPSFSYDEKPLAYLIEAQQLPRYDWVPVASGISDTKYKVKNLQRNQDYVFRIRGEFSSGLSQPSQHISVFRRPSRPGVPIARPEIFDEDSTSARLRWHRVYTPPYHRHSEPLSYHIEVQEAPSRQWRPLARGITMTEHTLTDLLPKKDYLFRLRAETPNGDISDPTPPVAYYKSPVLSPRIPRRTIDYKVFEQDYSVPSRSYVDHLTTFIPPRLPLDKPDLTEDGPSTVLLRWKPAQVPERARERYPVTYSIEVKNPPNLDWREVEGGLTTLSHKLENIHPEVDYMFRIRAHNEFGASEATLPVSLYRPIELVNYQEDEYDSDYEVPMVTLGDCEGPIDEVPPKLPMETPRLTNIMGDRVTMHWLSARIPAYAKKVPITYIVEIKEDNMPGFSRLQSGITDTKFTIDNLNPNMSYQFRVKAETQFGCSDPTLAVVLDRNKDGEEEVSLKLDDVRNLIQSLQDKSKRVSIDSRRDDLEIPQKKIRDLVPSGVPPRMSSSRPLISNHFGGDLTLTWGSGRVPSYVKGSTITYIVERRDPPHTTWTVVADNLTENEYDVIGLNTDRDYMFRVRAKNQYGTSEPTMPCSVINVKDDYVPPVFSRSQSRDSGTPRMSRRSSLESPLSLSRQMSLTDDSEDSYRTSLPPEFKSTVEDLQYGVLGRTARINLAIRGFPLPVVTWSYKGDNLTNKNKYKSLITPSGVITLDIYNFTMEDVGEYKCTAENDHGVKGYIVQLEFADAPTFLEPSEDLYLDIHKSGKFECRVDGIPYPKVRWMKDCRYVTESSRVKVTHTKPNLWTLQLSDVISLDGGLYTCEAENMAGKSVCSARLLVDAKIFKEVETVMRPVTFRDAVFEDYYYPLEELGRGRHGVVRRVIQKSTGDEYAAKIIPTCNEELKYFFGHELNNLRRANNQRVPSVVDAFQSERQLIIVLDLIKGRSLVDYILSCDKWTEAEAVKYIKQLLEILRSIHAINVAHLDIKPSNIYMADSESDQIRLIDFGFSRLLSLDYDVKMNYGTEEFTSPEQIQNEAVSSASDMWSVGILTYILLSGVSPLKGENKVDTLKKVVECNLKLSEENFKHVSEDAKDFLAELLVVDDIDRLSAAECLQHPWIRDMASKSTEPLDLGPLKAFNDIDNAERQLTNIRSIPNLYSLQSVQDQSIQHSPLSPVQGEQSEGLVFPDSDFFGEYVDEESWYDWQNRYHRGPGSKNVALSDNDYLAKVPGLKTTRRKINMDEDDEDEKQPKKRLVVVEADKNLYEDPCLAKELQYAVVADEVRQRKPADPQSKDRSRDEDLQIISKFTDMAFTPGDNIVLRCTVDTDEAPAVTWYRNEDMVTESSRLSVKTTANSTSLTVLDIKPYDVGIYKCVIRSKGGRATAAARILVGEVPSQPSRPVASKVSSTQVSLLWEPPATDGNSNVTGYRVDYKKKSGSSWTTVDFPIDECSLVSDLVPNTSYRFRVCAVNQFGSSAYSVASPEIVTEENGEKISLDDFTAGILSRQTGYPLIPAAPSGGNVQMTEGTYEEKYKITETLYSGKFSELIKAENISTGRVFVAKVFADKTTGSKEFETLKMMNHEKIARLYDGFLFNEKLYMITEYLCGVNVLQHFAFKSKYSEDMVAIVIRQVLEGVQYLGHMGVVHLNLQPSSIVMRSRCHLNLKICGFGRAQKVHGNGEVMPCVGYPDFIAPEVITREVTTFSADMWTVAVLCFMLLSGESPFRASTVEQTYTNIVYCRYDAHGLYDNITRDALRFIYRILKRVPRNRPTVEDCLEDKWLQLADTTVKARQETVFTTAKLRRFADIYRERGILGIWQPEYIPNEESNKEPVIEDVPVKQEMTVSKPGVKEQIMEDKMDKETEEKSDKVKEEETGTKETASEIDTGSSDGLTGSDMKSGIDKMAENLVTAAMDEAMKDKELK